MGYRKTSRFFTTTVLLLYVAIPAEAGEWDQLRRDAMEIRTIQADFVQTKALKILKEPLVSTGRFFYQAPATVRWEYFTPLRVVTIVNRGDVRRFTHTEDKGWVNDSSGSVQAMRVVMEKITGWLGGNFADDELFLATLEVGPPVVVTMTPKDEAMARFLKRVEVIFGTRPGVVETVRLHEGPGATTTITFKDARLNLEIPKSRFKDVE